jgi:glycosyltransferase involved in cell wall biosynthesis
MKTAHDDSGGALRTTRGRPVVTSNVGGMAELIQDGVNGYTFRVAMRRT